MNEKRRVYLIRRAIENEFGISEEGSDFGQGQALERMIRIVIEHARREAVIEGERRLNELHSSLDRIRVEERQEALLEGFAAGWGKMHLEATCVLGGISQQLNGAAFGLKKELKKRGGE